MAWPVNRDRSSRVHVCRVRASRIREPISRVRFCSMVRYLSECVRRVQGYCASCSRRNRKNRLRHVSWMVAAIAEPLALAAKGVRRSVRRPEPLGRPCTEGVLKQPPVVHRYALRNSNAEWVCHHANSPHGGRMPEQFNNRNVTRSALTPAFRPSSSKSILCEPVPPFSKLFFQTRITQRWKA